jgi:hypothetical protein
MSHGLIVVPRYFTHVSTKNAASISLPAQVTLGNIAELIEKPNPDSIK